ncbi:MAG: type II toxin-antitoxin system VapB family antitoxin [Verrucomicrobia bacterium]|nr:type II toxin-antitoxin system VapB family antitoxin [Verrucomicrobiota bacterium]MDA1067120.1 type II toxin-antitoxin system VapB family antitoxin [Verrucomicrobiota bacterium]
MDTAKLFKNGSSQAVRLPKNYRLPGKQVFIRRLGKGIVLMPEVGSWDTLIESIHQFTDDFSSAREQGEVDERESLFE